MNFVVLGGGDFRIDQNGKLYVISRLTRGNKYPVRVQVKDTNAAEFVSQQTATAEITIIADTHPPQFYQQMYEVFVPENQPPSE